MNGSRLDCAGARRDHDIRRSYAILVIAALIGTACSPTRPANAPSYDILITNANIVDGTGSAARKGAIAIAGGKIAAVGEVSGTATRTIDARGRTVAPGFIDLHSHSDMPLITDGNGQSKIRQGVTTEVIGESGSAAPRQRPSGAAQWTDFHGYFAALEKGGISPNLLSYVGLGTVREMVIGEDDRKPTSAEIEAMQNIVSSMMDQGVFGVSTGLIYPPNAYASVDELAAVSKPAADKGGLYASHLRYDGGKLREGIEEAIAIGERARLPVHVFHIKVTGQKNFGRMKEVIQIIEAARARGLRVTADQYPYVASSTGLTATIPPWAMDGGVERLVQRLQNPTERARIRKEMENENPSWESRYQSAGTWQNVQLAAIGRSRGAANDPVSPNRKYEGMRVAEAAKQAGKDPFDFVFDLLIEERGSVGCVYFIIDEADLTLAMQQPWVAIGSDGSALSVEGPLRAGVPHPRSFGTFPRVLGRYVRELKIVSLEEAIRKMSSLPASILGLEDRGAIKEGLWADLVVFDPATVADTATFEDPFQYPVGIDTVLVNGTVVLDEGTHTNARPGKVLRRTQSVVGSR
ncbi:MAG TPA: D-aminoacylase [Vicinamibacterales bacterium]|nr:D-aminoacylase [Vicinamibacterales bacterium]